MSSPETLRIRSIFVRAVGEGPAGHPSSLNCEAKHEAVRHIGYKLYEDLKLRLENSDPDEIANRKKEEADLLALFGANAIYAEKIPNEYSRSNRGWFLVTTKVGHIKIGWRKRVMVIDWSRTTNHHTADELFPHDDVTKSVQSIHAWCYDKAQEYLNKIMG